MLLALTLIIVSACSTAPTDAADTGSDESTDAAYYQAAPSPAPTEVLGVIKDRETWTLPFDPLFNTETSRLRHYALDLLVQQCMSEAGFTDYELLNDPTAPHPETQPHGDGVLFNVTIAQTYGYRMAPDPSYKPSRDNLDLGGGGYYDNKPEDFRDQLKTCDDEALALLFGSLPTEPLEPPPGVSIEDTFLSRLNRFTVDTSSPELQEAASQWRTCMVPLGISDLPQEPWMTAGREPLPPSLETRFDYWPTGQPSADEIAVATADAQCRDSSRWTDLLYEATWDQQAAFISAHQNDVDAYVADDQATAERMRTIIAETTSSPCTPDAASPSRWPSSWAPSSSPSAPGWSPCVSSHTRRLTGRRHALRRHRRTAAHKHRRLRLAAPPVPFLVIGTALAAAWRPCIVPILLGPPSI